MGKPSFNVDTHLFRELGELLVGRDSTALAELVKNAYDADASSVDVTGVGLRQGGTSSYIRIKDNGNGMTPDEFRTGFLTIAGRNKDSGVRTSPRFNRKYTGQKGIGRLAAHKLAKKLEVISIPDPRARPNESKLLGVKASIDWDKIEKRAKTFEEIGSTGAIKVEEFEVQSGDLPGTKITLRSLKRKWSDTQIRDFGLELGLLLPSDSLTNDPSQCIVGGSSLLGKICPTEAHKEDEGFSVEPLGDFLVGDDFGHTAVAKAHFVLEIDATESKVRFQISPLEGAKKSFKFANLDKSQTSFVATPESIHNDLDDDQSPPAFKARVLLRPGNRKGKNSGWSTRTAGISVFMESFRVLPYGESSDDWLEIKKAYGELRSNTSSSDLLKGYDFLEGTEGEMVLMLPSAAYFGGVFLTESKASGLSMLVNREGFAPSNDFDYITTVVKTGVAAVNRYRARLAHEEKYLEEKAEADAEEIPAISHSKEPVADLKVELEKRLESGRSKVKAAKLDIANNQPEEAIKNVQAAVEDYESFRRHADTMLDATWQLPVLASLGLQMASFVHEINGLIGHVATMQATLSDLRKYFRFDLDAVETINGILQSTETVNEVIQRQAAYLTDVTKPDRRRRASRQKIDERFLAALQILEGVRSRQGIRVVNDLPKGLSSSEPMYPAELTMVFTNLLSNALKACGENGEVFVHSGVEGKKLCVWIENTGDSIDLTDSERWFEPLESTTIATIDPVLGQGMGMGLPITRHLVELRRGVVHFVTPTDGYSTCIEIRFPK